jgi:hypothetical protein
MANAQCMDFFQGNCDFIQNLENLGFAQLVAANLIEERNSAELK